MTRFKTPPGPACKIDEPELDSNGVKQAPRVATLQVATLGIRRG